MGKFKSKLTEAQKRAIFNEYTLIEKRSEQWGFETRKAEELGVHRSTIHRITHDPKRVKTYLDNLGHVRDMAMGKILESQLEAVQTQVGLMNDSSLPQNLWYLRQNAAVDLMNRAGLKDKTNDDPEIRITFGAEGGGSTGLPAGMPPSDDDDFGDDDE